jgi:predicted Fe-S protein YdhL (DUF1289 family)
MAGMEITVPSPCRDICQLNASRICIGCGRSAAEIAEWPLANSDRRLGIRSEARKRVEAEMEQAMHATYE